MYSFSLYRCSIYFCYFDLVRNTRVIKKKRAITTRKRMPRQILLLPNDLRGFSALTSSKMSNMSVVSPSKDCNKSKRHWADTPLLGPLLAASCIKKGNFILFIPTTVLTWNWSEIQISQTLPWITITTLIWYLVYIILHPTTLLYDFGVQHLTFKGSIKW